MNINLKHALNKHYYHSHKLPKIDKLCCHRDFYPHEQRVGRQERRTTLKIILYR
jgi:hypothetical protein